MTEDDRPDASEYPGVVARYYRDHPWFGVMHLILTFLTGGMWAVGWFSVGFLLFWSGKDRHEEYRK